MMQNFQNPTTVTTNLLGEPTTQTNLYGSRSLATIYQNTATIPLWVSASITVSTSANVSVLCDDGANPVTQILECGVLYPGFKVTVFFLVLPGYYYKIVSVGSSVGNWFEWQ